MILPRRAPTHADVARHYGDLDRYYRELWGEHVHHGFWERGTETPEEAVEALVRLVADRAELGRGSRVCDVGSGYGATARWLTRERGARVTAVTVSPTQHAHARAAGVETDRPRGQAGQEPTGRGRAESSPDADRGPPDEGDPVPRYVLADWLENREPTGGYDAVLAIECLSHLSDVERGVAEMARVLRPGGRLVACVWLAREGARPWEVRHLLCPICEEGRLARLLTPAELHTMVAATGLEVEGVEDLSGRVARTWTVCLARAIRRILTDPETRRFLLDRSQPERVFARTLLRLRVAFATGSLRYGLVRATLPFPDPGAVQE